MTVHYDASISNSRSYNKWGECRIQKLQLKQCDESAGWYQHTLFPQLKYTLGIDSLTISTGFRFRETKQVDNISRALYEIILHQKCLRKIFAIYYPLDLGLISQALIKNTSLEKKNTFGYLREIKNSAALLRVMEEQNVSIKKLVFYSTGGQEIITKKFEYFTSLNRYGRAMACCEETPLAKLLDLLSSVPEEERNISGLKVDGFHQVSVIYGLLHSSLSIWAAGNNNSNK